MTTEEKRFRSGLMVPKPSAKPETSHKIKREKNTFTDLVSDMYVCILHIKPKGTQ